jgi:hypothetical protein
MPFVKSRKPGWTDIKQLLACDDDVSLLRDNIDTIKLKNRNFN